jgi:hypothetical protein
MAQPPKQLIRRLIPFEYNNTVRDLLNDSSQPASALPGEQSGNGFGNDAYSQSVSTLLVEQYAAVAAQIAARATAPETLGTLAPCAAQLGADSDAAAELSCVTAFVQGFAPRAYRRPLRAGEVEELTGLFQSVRAGGADFRTSLSAMIEGVLQTPQYLYRPEVGVPVPGRADLKVPTPHEMAARLSYFLWGTMPDPVLRAAADAGELTTAESVAAHARRMVDDERSRVVVAFFFDNLLPIASLSHLQRDAALYPTFTGRIGDLMRTETQTFLQYEIFSGTGTVESLLTAPYTFANQELAAYYGLPSVSGELFQQVPLDTSKRLGLLSHGGVVAGAIHSNNTNPVVRGAFVMRKLLCQVIPPPTAELAELAKPPDPYSGKTARERFSAHTQNPVCAGCHQLMDPIGFALENFDAVGLWRDTENDVLIDASGEMAILGGAFNGPVDLARKVAQAPQSNTCFASHWMNLAYGRKVDAAEEPCTVEGVQEAFAAAGYNVKELLVALTQADAFLYLPAGQE